MLSRPAYVGTDGPAAPARPFTGTVDEIVADVQAYVDAGVTDVTFMPYETDVSDQVALLETLGDEFLPSF